MRDWLRRHPGAWRAPLSLVAAVLAFATIAAFVLGACHGDDDIFCSSDDEFVRVYAVATVLAALTGAAFAALWTTRRATIALAVLVGGGGAVLLAVLVELT